jgi:hypothetical protein
VLVDFGSLVRTDDLRADLEIHQHCLYAELAPVGDGRCAGVNVLCRIMCADTRRTTSCVRIITFIRVKLLC